MVSIRWLWPHIRNAEDAKKAARQGAWLSLVLALWALLESILYYAGLYGEKNNYYLQVLIIAVVIFVLIALGIFKMSRAAAVIGFTFYLLGGLESIFYGDYKISLATTLLIIFFINSIRGTFKYHSLTGLKEIQEVISSESSDNEDREISRLRATKAYSQGKCPECDTQYDPNLSKCMVCGYDFYEHGLLN